MSKRIVFVKIWRDNINKREMCLETTHKTETDEYVLQLFIDCIKIDRRQKVTLKTVKTHSEAEMWHYDVKDFLTGYLGDRCLIDDELMLKYGFKPEGVEDGSGRSGKD